jgi:uncharacterized protein YkwD
MHELFANIVAYFSQFTWIDIIIVIIAVVYMAQGYAIGFISGILDIAGFLFSFAIALRFYGAAGSLLTKFFPVTAGIADIIGFIFFAIVIELLCRLLQRLVNTFVIHDEQLSFLGRANRLLGIIPGLLSGMILLSFFLTIFIVLPLSSPIKQAISGSFFGSLLVEQTQSLEKQLLSMFGGKADKLLTFFTIEPQAQDIVTLTFTYDHGVIDAQAEDRMLVLLNTEREKQHLDNLVMDDSLQQVARSHATDMLTRGYFAHNTPEGITPFDRMSEATITYQYAGENLALSPNVYLAMQGLMHSPGHKANILSSHFKKVGIGIINAGQYGEMFAQEFTD